MELNEQVWWYVARSGGIVAWLLITLSVCWGLFISTRATARATQPARLLDVHRFLGALAVTFTLIHIVGLVADNYVHFGWSEILVPFASEWRPGPVAWGVVAFYILLAVEVTSLVMHRLPRGVWMGIHRLSFVLYVFGTIHGIQAGSDVLNVWFQILMLASINIVAFVTIVLVLSMRKSRGRRLVDPAAPLRDPSLSR